MKRLLSLSLLLTPLAASAHPGHGSTPGTSLLHFLIEPAHGGLILAGAIGIALGIARSYRRTNS
jgi:hypothetical protein